MRGEEVGRVRGVPCEGKTTEHFLLPTFEQTFGADCRSQGMKLQGRSSGGV